MELLLQLENVTKRYGTHEALKSVNLKLPRGKVIGLLGPNGSGKTTFMKLLAGLITADSGNIEISGKRIGVETKQIVSYLPDRPYLPNYMKIKDAIDYFCDFYADFDKEKAEKMLKVLGLNGESRIKTLSKGMKEKVQLILVMSRKAELFLLDEPIGGVDPATREFIINTIMTKNENATVIITTHLISDIQGVLDEYIFIDNGRLTKYDSVKNLPEGQTLDGVFREVFKCSVNY